MKLWRHKFGGNKHKFGGTKIRKAEEVRKYFVNPEIENKVFD